MSNQLIGRILRVVNKILLVFFESKTMYVNKIYIDHKRAKTYRRGCVGTIVPYSGEENTAYRSSLSSKREIAQFLPTR